MHRLEEHLLERPELVRVINNAQSLSPEVVYSFVSLWLIDVNHSIQLKSANGNERQIDAGSITTIAH
jgi:hypothetical protein